MALSIILRIGQSVKPMTCCDAVHPGCARSSLTCHSFRAASGSCDAREEYLGCMSMTYCLMRSSRLVMKLSMYEAEVLDEATSESEDVHRWFLFPSVVGVGGKRCCAPDASLVLANRPPVNDLHHVWRRAFRSHADSRHMCSVLRVSLVKSVTWRRTTPCRTGNMVKDEKPEVSGAAAIRAPGPCHGRTAPKSR